MLPIVAPIVVQEEGEMVQIQMPTEDGQGELLLLPEPVRVTRLGGVVRLPERLTISGVDAGVASRMLGEVVEPAAGGVGVISAVVQTLADVPGAGVGEQRYAMRVAGAEVPGGAVVRIAAPSVSGARHALSTLRQLRRRFGGRLPGLFIEDAPAFAVRGVMLDISRCRVPTMGRLFEIVELLAGLKVNHLQLYTEHTFAYRGHEQVWAGASAMTPGEIERLDEHCRAFGVELAANQNMFGHMHRWLKHRAYGHLAETHGDWMFDVWPRSGPFSLCPTDPASEVFVAGLLDQIAPVFRSPLINIGCDETYDIAFGRSKEAVRSRGRARVYLEFVDKIAAMCRARGKRPMFWADIVLHEPGVVAELPEGLLGLCWGYEPDSAFAEWLGAFAQAGRPAWVCPGTSSWRAFFGRSSERTGNIIAAVGAGVAQGAGGVLTCDWGDEGHRQQWPMSAVGLAHGSAAGWNPAHAGELPLRAVSLHALGDATLASAGFIERVSEVDKPLREIGAAFSVPGATGRLRNASALFCDLHHGLESALGVGTIGQWRAVAEALAGERVPGGLGGLLGEQLGHALEVSRLSAARAVARRYKGGVSAEGRGVLCERLAACTEEFKRLWLIDSRPGGLDESVGKYEGVLRGMMEGGR